MANYTKIRIIHPMFSNPETEYIKEFFKYIGIIVYDETISHNQEWYSHLKLYNDTDGVDIVLNYYGKDFIPCKNRIYLYFDLESRICKVMHHRPLESQEQLVNSYNTNLSKKETRIEALNLLINKIWELDYDNYKAIQYIKDCYVSQSEDRDLFYILQEEQCCTSVLNWSEISKINEMIKEENIAVKRRNEKGYNYSERECLPTNLPLFDYVKTMFTELWRMHCLLENNNNPYVIYAKINTEMLLTLLYSYLYDSDISELSAIEYNGKQLKLNSIKEIANSIYNLYASNHWFQSCLFMLSNLNKKIGKPNTEIYNYLINKSKDSSFPAYYSVIYSDIAKQMLIYANEIYEVNSTPHKKAIDKIKEYLQNALQLDPQNYQANYLSASILAMYGLFNSSENFLKNIVARINSNDNDDMRYMLSKTSIKKIFDFFESAILSSKIAVNSNKMGSLNSYNFRATLYAIEFENTTLISIISDTTEKSYQEFIEHHRTSLPVWLLYKILEIWVVKISNDNYSRDVVKRKLSGWGK